MPILPIGSQVTYPDGTVGNKPKDQESFFIGDKHYLWDDYFMSWVDYKGNLWPKRTHSLPEIPIEQKTTANKNGCECGSWIIEGAKHSHYCKLAGG